VKRNVTVKRKRRRGRKEELTRDAGGEASSVAAREAVVGHVRRSAGATLGRYGTKQED